MCEECLRYGENRNYGVNGSPDEGCSSCSQAGKEARGESRRVSVCGSLRKKDAPFLSLLKTKCTKPSVVAERDKSVGLREGLLVRVMSSEIQC